MAPMLSLSCLGAPVAVSASGDPIRFRTRKHLALLVRLAVEPEKRFTRDYLTELLWPNAPARLASHSLAQGLSVIRAKLGRAQVLVQRATVALAQGAVEVDVLQLEQSDVEIRGTFLEGFDLPSARPFEDWSTEWRAKLLPKMRDVLVRRMDGGRRIGDFAAVEGFAHVLHDLDPLSEDAVRGMIEARAWVGDRTNALKAYAAYAARLTDELGAKPSPELERMANLLREGRRGAGAGGPGGQSNGRPQAVGEPPARAERRFDAETLIGREREFSVLYDAWLAARRRVPTIVVVTGDAGLGKTTLANAFVSNCQLEGAVVARAQAYDAERELPFAILAELVRQLAVQRAIGCADPEALSELSRLTPEVATQFPGVPKPTEWAAEIVPLRLADAFLKSLSAAAEESPVVLVVDDLHAADNASAAILHLVARKLPATRLLMILAARSTELWASGTPAALATDPLIEALRSLELEPLAEEASTQLVGAVQTAAGEGAGGDLPMQRILNAGRGNPLALELLTREWLEHGPESLLRDLEAVNTQPAAALGVPRAIKAVFDRQVARLDARTRSVLDLAAVLGRRLADLSLYQAVGCSAIDASEGLARLRNAGLVREVHGDLEFRNELIRAQAYYAIPVVGRRHMHRSVGTLLEPRSRTSDQSATIEIAWHYLRADDNRRALEFGLLGAEQALAVGAPSEAERLLSILLPQTEATNSAAKLKYLLATALVDQSKGDRAIPILEELAREDNLTKRERAVVASLLAAAEYLQNRNWGQRHTAAARTALDLAYDADDPELVIRALFEHAQAGYEMGDEHAIQAVKDEVQRLLQDSNVARLARAHFTLGFCHQFVFDAHLALESIEKAMSLLNPSTDLAELAAYLSGQGFCAFSRGELSVAHAAWTKGMKISRHLGDESRVSRIAANLCTVESFRGNYEQALAYGELSVKCGARNLNQPFLVGAYANQIDPYLMTGQRERALECLENARRWIAQDRSWHSRVAFLCEEASVALLLGNPSAAIRLIVETEEMIGGRARAGPEMGVFTKLQIFKAGHDQAFEKGFALASEGAATFRDRCPLIYLDILAARAWLEKLVSGSWSTETRSELPYFDKIAAHGRRALLTAQGFLA